MLIKVYSVYDKKTLAYNTPYFAATDGAATRSFQELAGDLSTTVGKYPHDYSLYYIGEYDIDKGQMIPVLPIRHVVDANALLVKQAELPLERATRAGAVPGDGGMFIEKGVG